jgi:amino acid transporter
MEKANGPGRISMFGAAFMGVGAMVGAGIFVLLGEAGAIAGAAVWLSFLIAGAISLLQGYSFVKLGARYPSQGGTIEFLVQGFGNGHVTGSVSWLYYLVGQIVTVMVALSFGSYAGALFFGDGVSQGATKLLALVIIVVMALLNLETARGSVARVQTAIVWAVITILGGFSYITIRNGDFSLLSPDNYPGVSSIISSVALTFFAFLGFAVVAFAAGDMEDPRKDLPRAMYLSLIITTVLYVAIAIGVFSMLTLEEVIAAGNTAIAKAAEPILGSAGFTIMTIAAVFSTSSAVNSQFFATTGVVAYLTKIGQFPRVLGRQAGKYGNVGTVISTILVCILALLFDLSAIASIGSAVGLVVFMMVDFAHLKLAKETGAKPAIIYLSIVTVVITLLVFTFETLVDERGTMIALVVFLVLAVVVDRFWRNVPSLRAEEAMATLASEPSQPQADPAIGTAARQPAREQAEVR